MTKNIVVLSGTPRKDGNSARLAEAFIEGAEATGKEVAFFRVAGLKIQGCRGCKYCFKNQGACIQKDDMPPILDALRKADALVLASPVYFCGLTAQIKLVIDRFYASLHTWPKLDMQVKRSALLMTCGEETEAGASSSISTFRQICTILKWEEAGVIIAPGLHNPGDIEGRPELEQAKRLGESI